MERRKMKKKGFTLVELLVVIAIIAMLLAILMPALGKVRQLAQRIMCSTNLSGLGKAMLTYSNDDKYESFPIAGASGSYWNTGASSTAGTCSWDWRISTFVNTATPGYATISSCLYLLVKIADTTPEQFICPGSDNKKFDLANYSLHSSYSTATFTDVWDFGRKSDAKASYTMGKGHNTYSYQLPLPIRTGQTAYPISTTSNPAKAVMADRNPYWQYGVTAYLYTINTSSSKVYDDSITNGNNTYHQKEGQNVLYADNHAKFEKTANCAISQDNIYTCWNTATLSSTDSDQRRMGGTSATGTIASTTSSSSIECGPIATMQSTTSYRPQNDEDNYLVSDVDNY